MKGWAVLGILAVLALAGLLALLGMVDGAAKSGCTARGGTVVADSTDVGWRCVWLPERAR